MEIKEKLPVAFKELLLKALRNKTCFKYAHGALCRYESLAAGQEYEYTYCALGVVGKIVSGRNIHGVRLNMDNMGEDWDKVPAAFKQHAVQDEIMLLNDNNNSYEPAANWIEKNL